MKRFTVLFYAIVLVLLSCKNSTPTTAYDIIKTKILNDSIFANLPNEEQSMFTDSLVYKLQNDTDFNTYAKNMETLLLSRIDSTKQQSTKDKKKLIMAISGMGAKFPELRKLDKATQKEIMEKAGDTLTRDLKNQLKVKLSEKTAEAKLK